MTHRRNTSEAPHNALLSSSKNSFVADPGSSSDALWLGVSSASSIVPVSSREQPLSTP